MVQTEQTVHPAQMACKLHRLPFTNGQSPSQAVQRVHQPTLGQVHRLRLPQAAGRKHPVHRQVQVSLCGRQRSIFLIRPRPPRLQSIGRWQAFSALVMPEQTAQMEQTVQMAQTERTASMALEPQSSPCINGRLQPHHCFRLVRPPTLGQMARSPRPERPMAGQFTPAHPWRVTSFTPPTWFTLTPAPAQHRRLFGRPQLLTQAARREQTALMVHPAHPAQTEPMARTD